MTARVVLKPKRARPFFGQHPWVFAGAIDRVEGNPNDGDPVALFSHEDVFIAHGLFNGRSKIRVRLFSWDRDQPLDNGFWKTCIATAMRLRREVLGLGGPGRACRLVFSEADGLSGLVVDQYDGWLIVQFTSLGLAQRQATFVEILSDLLKPSGIYLRTEKGIGQLEGLELRDGLLAGTVPTEPIIIHDGGLRFQVQLTEGQKTGFYLDQRDNRLAVARFAKGRRVLDAFCYSGGFALHAAQVGASSVLGIDASETALHLARTNAQLNGLNVEFEKSDVFVKLDRLVAAGEKFGVIVLDPPKFARTGQAIDDALRGYRRLQTQALKLLESDGILAMCCCSGLIAAERLHELLAQVATEARRPIQILETRGAAADHPMSAACPETNYLKCVICRVV